MRPEQLNRRITIQRQQSYEDEDGIAKETWQDKYYIWAGVNNLYGKEYWEAKRYEAENAVTFTVRFAACPDLKVSDRVLFDGRIYNINSIDNVLYKNEILKIKAVAVL